jgi:photosystem II stability/assembly factor-like uncharacterized protein
MGNFKRIIAGMVIFALCIGALQGCSKNSEASAASESVTTVSQPTTAACEPSTASSESAAAAAPGDKTDVTATGDESQNPDSVTSNWKEVHRMKIEQKTYYAGFLTDTYGLTVGYGGEIHYTNDGGKTWPASENKSLCRFGLDMLNGNFALTSGNGGNNRISGDSGKTWQAITDYGSTQPSQNKYVSIVDENTFWLASNAKMALSVDSGKTWQEIKTPENMKPISAISFQTANDGYVLNAKGTLFATKDGGKTWSEQSIDFHKLNLKDDKLLNYSAAVASLRFTDSQNAVLALYGILNTGARVIILKTTDGGKTWEDEILPDNYPVTTVFLSRDAKYLTLYSTNSELIVLNDTE